ncbi:pectinesterase family protein [Paenibacillus tarimensis]
MNSKVLIHGISILFVILMVSGCSSGTKSGEPNIVYDAVVDSSFTGTDGEIVEGVKMFKTVQSAADSPPTGTTEKYVIFIRNGTYYEKVTVQKPYITLLGESEENTVITFDAAAGMTEADGSKYGTSGSATLSVYGPFFTAKNLTILNSFDYMANMAKTDDDPTKIHGSQAVALKTGGFSQKAVFSHVTVSSFQDTLLADEGTQYYEHCTIKGAVDFIFGAGQAVFNDCDIISLDRKSQTNNGFITAASTKPWHDYGFLFINSRLLKESEDMADGTVALGRPWHPSSDPGRNPAVVFVNTYMDAHISAKGWEPMSGHSPMDARFYEYGSTGPGAFQSETRRVLSESEGVQYTIENVLDGWNPAE